MKKLFALVFVLLVSCTISEEFSTAHENIQSKFVGRWTGWEKDQQIKGMEKHWILDRFADGTYSIEFTITEYGETYTKVEEGKWWIQDGKYCEHYSGWPTPDIYTYIWLDDEHVKTKIFSTELEIANPDYEYLDSKVKTDIL